IAFHIQRFSGSAGAPSSGTRVVITRVGGGSRLNNKARSEGFGEQAMNNRIVYLLALIVLAASPLSASAQQGAGAPGEVLTLDEAVSLALRENRPVRNAQLSVGQAGDALAAARTLRLPTVHVYS